MIESGLHVAFSTADAFLDLQRTRDKLAALLAALPAGWADAAWAHLGSSSVTEADALAVVRDSLVWQLGDTPVTCSCSSGGSGSGGSSSSRQEH